MKEQKEQESRVDDTQYQPPLATAPKNKPVPTCAHGQPYACVDCETEGDKWRTAAENYQREAFNLSAERQRTTIVLKLACDRTWENETPEQVVNVAANALFWRNEEITRLRAELEDARSDREVTSRRCGSTVGGMTIVRTTRVKSLPSFFVFSYFYSPWEGSMTTVADLRGKVQAIRDLLVITSGFRKVDAMRLQAAVKLADELDALLVEGTPPEGAQDDEPPMNDLCETWQKRSDKPYAQANTWAAGKREAYEEVLYEIESEVSRLEEKYETPDPPVRHGVDCGKVPHEAEGYLHGAHDDGPYDVDGLTYCGRCHEAI